MQRPNIIFVIADHANALAVAPDSPGRNPTLNKLAAEGRRFHRAYTTNAICSPARASLMTGLYPSTHGMWDCCHTQRREWLDVPASRFRYFSQVLAENGYATGYFGKWHVEQSGQLDQFGWQEFDLKCAGFYGPKAGDDEAVIVKHPGYSDCRLAGVAEVAEPRHPAFERGIDFLRRHSADDRPFCLFLAPAEPHDPYVPPRRFLEQFDLNKFPLPPTLRTEPVGKPEVIRRQRQLWSGLTDAQWRRARASYFASLSFLDAELGRLLDVLRATGRYDNTIIVFTSDHGDMLGAHGLITKGHGTGYEPVYNIPLVLRVPGQAGGIEDRDHCVSMVDLAPTLLDLCSLPALPGAQGRSLRPVLEGTAAPADWQQAYAEFYGQRFVLTQRITWHGDWKYIFTPAGCDELYNLREDPEERRNLADRPEHRATLEAMCRRMWQQMKRIGDDSLYKSEYATLRVAPLGPRG